MGLKDLIKRMFNVDTDHAANKESMGPASTGEVVLPQIEKNRKANQGDIAQNSQRPSKANSRTNSGTTYGRKKTSEKTLKLKTLIDLLHEESPQCLSCESAEALLNRVMVSYSDLDDGIATAAIDRLSFLASGNANRSDFESFQTFVDKIYDPILNDSVKLDEVKGRRFVLTGDFAVEGGKETLTAMINTAGGKTTGGVSRATDYVVAGSLGSSAWGLGRYGGKIKDAVVSHLNGCDKPFILSEKELVSFLDSNCQGAAQVHLDRKDMFKKQWESARVVSRSFDGLTLGQQQVFDLVKAGRNVYLTGLGGTGKSYVVEKIIQWAKDSGKNTIVCAPTGIAALNIGGTTIHRALGIRPEKTLDMKPYPAIPQGSAIPECDLMIVDEISMCRMDLFDYLSSVLKKAGVNRKKEGKALCQLVVVGDFCQLAPVVKAPERKVLDAKYGYEVRGAYPFMGTHWDSWHFEKVELTEAIRQRDANFVAALNACRMGDLSGVRWIREHASQTRIDDAIFLCGRNDEADAENEAKLNALTGKASTYRARIEGVVTGQDKPTADTLILKSGARVMALVNNDETTYMNGSIGTVVSCEKDGVVVDFDGLGRSTVVPHEWEITVPKLVDGKTENEIIGTFLQVPLRLAWAITIHKAQGQTFERANIDPECWEYGQLYTALSRLTEVSNMHILGFMNDSFLKTSPDVIDFLNGRYVSPTIEKSSIANSNNSMAAQKTIKTQESSTAGKTRHLWTAEEEQFILDHPEMTARELAERFSVTVKAVERRKAKLRKGSM